MFFSLVRKERKGQKEESVPLFVLFVLFGQAKRTLKEKFLYVSSRVVEGADPYKLKPKYSQ